MTFDVWWVHRTDTADTRSVAHDAWCAAEDAARTEVGALRNRVVTLERTKVTLEAEVESLIADHRAARRRVKELVDERDDLRAKVERLRHEDECDISRGRIRPETGVADCNCLRGHVLALLPEVREEWCVACGAWHIPTDCIEEVSQ